MAKDISVIIPFINEFPQNLFTVESIMSSLEGVDFEVLLVDNKSIREEAPDGNNTIRQEIDAIINAATATGTASKYDLANKFESYVHGRDVQGRAGDRTHLFMKGHRRIKEGTLQYIQYDEKQSHWCAKREALKVATGKVCFFTDAHNFVFGDSLKQMLRYYQEHEEELNGSLHMPVHNLLEPRGRAQVYKIHVDKSRGILHYGYTGLKVTDKVHRVPAMIYCSCMLSRKIIDKLGLWPSEFGIWGSGESFANFSLAVCGYKVSIWPFETVRHLCGGATKRGYSYHYWDLQRNKMISLFCVVGEEWMRNFIQDELADNLAKAHAIGDEVVQKLQKERQNILDNQTISIEGWAEQWIDTPYLKA